MGYTRPCYIIFSDLIDLINPYIHYLCISSRKSHSFRVYHANLILTSCLKRATRGVQCEIVDAWQMPVIERFFKIY